MATGSTPHHLPTFEEIIRRGYSSEPRTLRPVPKVSNQTQVADLSLNHEVEANKSKQKEKGKQNSKGEDDLLSESSKESTRRRTPMTLPRTKITPATPLEQRVALNRLKQKLYFEEKEMKDKQKSNGKNKKNGAKLKNTKRSHIPLDGISNVSSVTQSEMSDINIGKMNERLEQVRGYLKQATSMYVSLSIAGSEEPKRADQMSKLARLIQQLRIQEQGYLDLFQKTMVIDDEQNEGVSIASNEQSVQSTLETNQNNDQITNQQQELERLREQQSLLKKIVDQQKELQQLKEKQAALLEMQEDAEILIQQQKAFDSVPNNQRNIKPEKALNSVKPAKSNVVKEKQEESAASHKRLELEKELLKLHEKKDKLDKVMDSLTMLKNSQQVEANMSAILNQDDLNELTSELASSIAESYSAKEAYKYSEDGTDEDKEQQLNQIRQRLNELRGMCGAAQNNTESSEKNIRDNRLHAQAIQDKEADTLTGLGGARLRLPNAGQQNVLINDLQTIQNAKDNRNKSQQTSTDTDFRNSLKLKKKNTNQEKKRITDLRNLESFLKDLPKDYMDKLKELQNVRQLIEKHDSNTVQSGDEMVTTQQVSGTQTESYTGDSVSEKDSDIESELSTSFQWQDDPEFQNKVKKLEMAKEKLHHLQKLVRVVQQNGGPHLPVDDLENLTLSISDDQNEMSEYEESDEEEEEATENNLCETGEDQSEDDELADGEQTEDDEKSEVSKSTDVNYNFGAIENGLSDNERRYQGLLRKQRLELNYLLKERERLLEAQKKLSSLAVQTSENEEKPDTSPKKNKKSFSSTKNKYRTLTKEELNKQDHLKQKNVKGILLSKINGVIDNNMYAPTDEIVNPSEDKVAVTAPLKNPMAVTEIRRQRELFEQKKKQKFVEKHQRKKNRSHGDEIQSDDRATYSIHSDIDEGVGVSMHSADVTTAATWGGSTEQSSSEEDDSAVGEDYSAARQIINEDPTEGDRPDDDYGSHFDQPEEEEELTHGVDNLAPIFKVNTKFEGNRPTARRGITWYTKDVTPGKKRKLTDKKSDASQGSVSWSFDISPPQSVKPKRQGQRQGNLTPAHKLMQDQQKKEFSRKDQQTHLDQEFQSQSFNTVQSSISEQLQTQLASMCTSLLRNEQTLLTMLQNERSTSPNRDASSQQRISESFVPIQGPINQNAFANLREFFQSTNRLSSIQETLGSLHQCYERMEQHKLDMEYLQHQFSLLNPYSHNNTNPDTNMPNPSHLLINGFGNEMNSDGSLLSNNIAQSPRNLSKTKKLSHQKETQTDTTLFEDPFKPSIQPYTLFGESVSNGATVTSPNKKEDSEFVFQPVVDQSSPGAVGDRSFNHVYDTTMENDDGEITYPYRLQMSEYNPLSYQGNFPNTSTGNVLTISRMSMNKEQAETNVTDQNEKIWPSFFKLNTNVTIEADCETEKSTNVAQEKPLDEKESGGSKPEAHDNDGCARSSGESNFSLFEALRDSIYSEVATLIAMNETRPHYLIELFRELQLLNSDYLRQRALYSLQELVTRFLTDDQVRLSPIKKDNKQESVTSTEVNAPAEFEKWMHSASEQTPSESMMTSEDEGEVQALQSLARQIQNNEMYDYAEVVDSLSECNLSTPGSQCENPFASEDLGNTVINLDEALQKMRCYEQNLADAKKAFEQITNDVQSSTLPSVSHEVDTRKRAAFEALRQRINKQSDSISSSSACDVASDTSSEMPQPSVDTQKLDQQIKSVMIDLIPFLNENIDCSCTDEILDQIRHLIVKLAKEKEPESEKEQFGRFFHMQLDSILKDSLMKFHGRKIKESGEDILIDISEILFNELAFFKLMQDLDRPLTNEPIPPDVVMPTNAEPLVVEAALPDGDAVKSKMPFVENNSDRAAQSCSVESIEFINPEPNSNSTSSTSSSNFIMVDHVVETDEETESARQFVKVELSASESKPVRSSGSGEDDNGEEMTLFPQASVPTSSYQVYTQQNQASPQQVLEENTNELNTYVEREETVNIEDDRDEGDQFEQEDERSEHERVEAQIENENAEDQQNLDGGIEADDVNHFDDVDTQVEADGDDAAEDDLPEADMVADNNIAIAQVILDHLDGQQEIVGDINVSPPS